MWIEVNYQPICQPSFYGRLSDAIEIIIKLNLVSHKTTITKALHEDRTHYASSEISSLKIIPLRMTLRNTLNNYSYADIRINIGAYTHTYAYIHISRHTQTQLYRHKIMYINIRT